MYAKNRTSNSSNLTKSINEFISKEDNKTTHFQDNNLEGIQYLTSIEFAGNPLPEYVFKDKLNQQFILSMLSPYIEEAVKNYYGEFRQYMDAGILNIIFYFHLKLNENRRLYLKLNENRGFFISYPYETIFYAFIL